MDKFNMIDALKMMELLCRKNQLH